MANKTDNYETLKLKNQVCFPLHACSKELVRQYRPLITLSFLFYIPVAVAASLVPMLGMLMLPKTVCYMLLIWCFRKYAFTE